MLLKPILPVKELVYSKAKVLVIDDDQTVAEILKEYFQMMGFCCYTRNYVQDIIELVNEIQPSVIILDYMLPGINGGDLCARVKSEFYIRNIPIIIYSAYPKILLSLGNYGANEFIAKPFDLERLMKSVKLHLYGKWIK